MVVMGAVIIGVGVVIGMVMGDTTRIAPFGGSPGLTTGTTGLINGACRIEVTRWTPGTSTRLHLGISIPRFLNHVSLRDQVSDI